MKFINFLMESDIKEVMIPMIGQLSGRKRMLPTWKSLLSPSSSSMTRQSSGRSRPQGQTNQSSLAFSLCTMYISIYKYAVTRITFCNVLVIFFYLLVNLPISILPPPCPSLNYLANAYEVYLLCNLPSYPACPPTTQSLRLPPSPNLFLHRPSQTSNPTFCCS